MILLLAGLLSACASPVLLAPGTNTTNPSIEPRAFIASDGFRLRYSLWKAPAPKAIILALHGMNDYGQAFDEAAAHWARHDVSTYAYDQRGFGRTLGDGVWPGDEVLIRDLQETATLLRAKHPGLPLFVLGESMGAAVILAGLGSTTPPQTDAAILVSPALNGWSELGLLERVSLWTMAHVSPGSRLSGRGLGLKPSDNVARLKAMALDPYVLKRTRIDALYGLVTLMERAQTAAPRVSTPALILYGTGDNIAPQAPIEALAGRLAGPAQIHRRANGHHLLLRDEGAEVLWNYILEYIAEHRPYLKV